MFRKVKGLDEDDMACQCTQLPAINEEDEEKARDQTDHEDTTQEPEIRTTFAAGESPCSCEVDAKDYIYPTDEFDQMGKMTKKFKIYA